MAENKREGIRAQLRDLIMGQLQERGHTEDAELLEYIDQAVFHMGQQVYLPLKERLWLRNSLYDSFRRLDILQELLDDKSVTEIMINGAGKIFIEQSGNVRLWERRFEKPEQLEDIIQQVVSRVNRVVNVSSPIVDARLEDGSRVHVVLPPVALDGPAVTIRKFPEPHHHGEAGGTRGIDRGGRGLSESSGGRKAQPVYQWGNQFGEDYLFKCSVRIYSAPGAGNHH